LYEETLNPREPQHPGRFAAFSLRLDHIDREV